MKHFMVLAIVAAGSLWGCGESQHVAWVGEKPQTRGEEVAYATCMCLYSVLEEKAEGRYDPKGLAQEAKELALGDPKALKERYPTPEAIEAAFPNMSKYAKAFEETGGIPADELQKIPCMVEQEREMEAYSQTEEGAKSNLSVMGILQKQCPIVEIID